MQKDTHAAKCEACNRVEAERYNETVRDKNTMQVTKTKKGKDWLGSYVWKKYADGRESTERYIKELGQVVIIWKNNK